MADNEEGYLCMWRKINNAVKEMFKDNETRG
jgi:hypothetical protein